MHRCLNIIEVQHISKPQSTAGAAGAAVKCCTALHSQSVLLMQAIFLEVLDKPRGKATLAGLARTCRTLSNTALNVLWARLPSIACLIRCLPSDLWKIENHRMIFRRPMAHSHWKVLFGYSSRVRSLSRFGAMGSCASLSDDVILALSQPPSYGPLLPYLETLDVYQEINNAYTPLLQQLLTGSLTTLRLPRFVLSSPATLMQLASRCPSVKRLCFNGGPLVLIPDIISRNILSETTICLDSLQSFECRALNEAAIIHLSRLSSLVKLSLALDHNVDLERVKSGLVSLPQFTALESLTLEAGALSTLTSLLEAMRFKPRSVSFLTQDTPSPDSFRLFFITLVNACDREQITEISLSTDSEEWLSDDEREQISLFTFQSLLVFPNVESFVFDSMCNMFFDDDAMKTVTKHWPKLVTFSVNASSGWGIESRITHRGLLTLLRCPALREFALSVNMVEIDLPQDRIPDSRPGNGLFSRCEHAQFVTSIIDHPATIAAFLSDVCPLLKTVSSGAEEWEEEKCTQSWEEVNNLLPAFLAIRKQCWNWRGKRKRRPHGTIEISSR